MRHPGFEPGIFTALIKTRNFRPLSLVLASMHSHLFHKKRIVSFCPFSSVFWELSNYCRVLSVYGLSTRKYVFAVGLLGTAGNWTRELSHLKENHTTRPLSYELRYYAFLDFFQIKFIAFFFKFFSFRFWWFFLGLIIILSCLLLAFFTKKCEIFLYFIGDNWV